MPLLQNLTKTVNWKSRKLWLNKKVRSGSGQKVQGELKNIKIKIYVFSCHHYKIWQWLWIENPAKYDFTNRYVNLCIGKAEIDFKNPERMTREITNPIISIFCFKDRLNRKLLNICTVCVRGLSITGNQTGLCFHSSYMD